MQCPHQANFYFQRYSRIWAVQTGWRRALLPPSVCYRHGVWGIIVYPLELPTYKYSQMTAPPLVSTAAPPPTSHINSSVAPPTWTTAGGSFDVWSLPLTLFCTHYHSPFFWLLYNERCGVGCSWTWSTVAVYSSHPLASSRNITFSVSSVQTMISASKLAVANKYGGQWAKSRMSSRCGMPPFQESSTSM